MFYPSVLRLGQGLLLALALCSCGGGGGGDGGAGGSVCQSSSVASVSTSVAGSNVLPISVNAGPSNLVNRLYASVTVCVPGYTDSSHCRTVDNVLVDTGSTGLRLLSSALSSLPLTGSSPTLLNCQRFLDGSFAWGSVVQADITLGSEVASNTPMQIIADPSYTSLASDCSSSGDAITTVSSLGANGILGVSMRAQDCGSNCQSNANNGYYYQCNSVSSCSTANPSTAIISKQLTNPVTRFAADNNGLEVVLPAVSCGGAAAMNGSLVFGVGTQANNQPTGRTLLQTQSGGSGYVNAAVSAASLGYSANMAQAFLDTGSNGIFFSTAAAAPMPSCYSQGFFCPSALTNFSATLSAINGASSSVNFAVDNANTLFNSSSYALPTLGGPVGSLQQFDWGLPFFYGRSVFIGFDGKPAGAFGTGPYYAL